MDAARSHIWKRTEIAALPAVSVYNRLVDFAFEQPDHALRAAHEDRVVVVTTNPYVHALFYADMRNLSLLSDQAGLRA